MDEVTPLALAVGLHGRRCVCVGGGGVAARRIPALLDAGGQVTVIAPDLHPDLARLRDMGAFEHRAREYRAGDLAGARFVLAATGVRAVDAEVAAAAQALDALTCVAGDPALGNCHFMATVRRGALLVGIYSAGVAPAVSGAVRRRIEASLPDYLEDVLERLGDLRVALRAAVPDAQERSRRWQRAVASGAIDALLRTGDEATLEEIRSSLLS